MPQEDSTVEELLAVHLICEFEDLDDVERLEPDGSPTADWRLTTVDGRVADVEVTWDTNEDGRWFESQLGEEQIDEGTLTRFRSSKEWADERLSMVWCVVVYDDAPGENTRPAKDLVKALIAVLAEVEALGGTPEQMLEAAQERLVDPREHRDRHDFGMAWQEASDSGVTFERSLLSWGEETGYWYPPLLVDDLTSPARYVSVEQVYESEGPSGGMVRTSPAVFDFAVGEYGHMLYTVQHHIDRKTAKRQMENAPGLKWLFVVFDDNMAAGQLDDCFGPDASKPYPYDLLDEITFDYFDEVWVTGRSFHDRHHVVLRLFKTDDAPQHKIVRRAEVLAG